MPRSVTIQSLPAAFEMMRAGRRLPQGRSRRPAHLLSLSNQEGEKARAHDQYHRRRFREARRRTGALGVFQDRTSMDRIHYAVPTRENRQQGVNPLFALTHASWRYPTADGSSDWRQVAVGKRERVWARIWRPINETHWKQLKNKRKMSDNWRRRQESNPPRAVLRPSPDLKSGWPTGTNSPP